MKRALVVTSLAVATLLVPFAARAQTNSPVKAPAELDAASVQGAVTRFALDPNPGLLVGFDAATAPLPSLDEPVSPPASPALPAEGAAAPTSG